MIVPNKGAADVPAAAGIVQMRTAIPHLRATGLLSRLSLMNEHIVKFGASFIAGTVATAGLVRLIGWAPIPSYTKFVLAVVVPIPTIAIALVLIYYGPEAQAGGENITGLGSPGDLLKMFLYGCLATFGYAGVTALWRMFQPQADREDDADDDNE